MENPTGPDKPSQSKAGELEETPDEFRCTDYQAHIKVAQNDLPETHRPADSAIRNSPAPNYGRSKGRGKSPADFVHKLGVVLKELHPSGFASLSGVRF